MIEFIPFLSVLLWSCQSLATSPGSGNGIIVSNGLVNLGNTCYLNAQLQCAYHVPLVRDLILEEDEDMDEDASPSLLALRDVFASMTVAVSSLSSSKPSPSTAPLVNALGINRFEQHDSQEFWKLLLPELDHPSITSLYRGSYESYVSAIDGSGRERRRSEPFLDLSVDVSNSNSVDESLGEQFGVPELLEVKEGNGWKPPPLISSTSKERGEPVDALKGQSLSSKGLPSILQLHLMRFTFDWRTENMEKINDRFAFDRELDLSFVCTDVGVEPDTIEESEQGRDDSITKKGNKFVSRKHLRRLRRSCVYDLQAVLVHTGGYGSGHYYSYVRPDVRKDVWYKFDDDRVSKVGFRRVVEDAFGGDRDGDDAGGRCDTDGGGFWGKILGRGRRRGGRRGTRSSAYMLQYVRRRDAKRLYGR